MGGGDQLLSLLVAAARAAAPRAGTTRVIALDGRSGAGKTTLARTLSPALDGAPIVALEDLYGGWDGLADGARRLVDDVLAPLAATGRAAVPAFDWRAGTWSTSQVLKAPPVLVVEGVGAGSRAAAPFTSVLAWVELDDLERRRRALARDEGLYDAHWERWARQEDAYLAAEDPRGRADLRVAADGPPVRPADEGRRSSASP